MKRESEELTPINQIKIFPYKEKKEWELIPKYSIGLNLTMNFEPTIEDYTIILLMPLFITRRKLRKRATSNSMTRRELTPSQGQTAQQLVPTKYQKKTVCYNEKHRLSVVPTAQ